MASRLRAPLALVLLVVAALPHALLRGEVLYGRDLVAYTYPRMQVLGEALVRGEVPRWNPWAYHGCTWFGPRAGGVVYPGHLLFGLFDPALAMALFVAAHLLVAAEGMRRLVTRDAPGAPATLAGVLYGLGSFHVAMYGLTPYLVSGALLPWVLHGARRAAKDAPGGLAVVGASLGLVVLAVEVQGAAMAALCAVALGAWEGSRGGEPRRDALRAATWVALGVGAALAIGGLSVLSIVDELPRTNRQLAGFTDARYGLGLSGQLLSLVVNGALGEDALDLAAYWGFQLMKQTHDVPWATLSIGAVGLAAAVTAVARGGRAALPPAALVLCGFALAAARAGEGLRLRFPAKWLVLSAVGLAWLAGIGADRWRRGQGLSAGQWTLGATLLTAAALVVAFAAVPAESLWTADAAPFIADGVARKVTTIAGLRAAAVAATALVVLTLLRRRRLAAGPALALLLGLAGLELVLCARARLTTTDAPLLEKPWLVDVLEREGGDGLGPLRYEGSPSLIRGMSRPAPQPGRTDNELLNLFDTEFLVPGITTRWRVRGISAFESIGPRELFALSTDERFLKLPRALRLALCDAATLLFRVDEVDGMSAQTRRLTAPIGKVHYGVVAARNLACPDWAYLVEGVEPVTDEARAIARLVDPRRFPTETVLLGPDALEGGEVVPSDLPAPAPPTRPDLGRVLSHRFEDEAVELEVEAARPCWLVVRDAFHPDWRVTLDGAPAPALRADLLYRGVQVPPGVHRVAFAYDPWWWGPGLRLMAFGLLVTGAAGVLAWRRAKLASVRARRPGVVAPDAR